VPPKTSPHQGPGTSLLPLGAATGRPLATRQGARLARQHRRLASIDAGRLRRRYRLSLISVWLLVTALTALMLATLSAFSTAEVFFITTVTSVIALPLLARSAVPQWLLERTLSAEDQDAALATGHLSRRLASLAQSTRFLRLAIEESGAEDSNADREIWSWIAEVRELAPEEQTVLDSLGLSVDGVEAALLTEVEEREKADEEALARVDHRRMEVIAEQLEGFETALLRHNPDPYR